MSLNNSQTRVSIFLFLTGILTVYMFFYLSPSFFTREKKKTYYTFLNNASGIIPKTHVKTNGVIIGKVISVKLQVSNTRIDFSIRKDVVVPLGSKVVIREKGFLGDVFLEVIRTRSSGQFIENNSLIEADTEQMSIADLVQVAGKIGKDVRKITKVFSSVVGGERGGENLEDILANIKGFLRGVRNLVDENRADIRAIVKNFNTTSDTLGNSIKMTSKDLKVILSDVKHITHTFKSFIDKENKNRIFNIVSSLDQTVNDLKSTASDVRLIANRVENGQGTLGKLINNDDTIQEIEGAVRDVRELLSPAKRLSVDVDYHTEVEKNFSSQHYFNTHLRTRPDKYYVLGVTDMRESIKETTIEYIETSESSPDALPKEEGDTTRTKRERIQEKSSLRFNLQFAKRWYDFQLRFGLFESTGGFALDYYLIDDQMKFTFEAFDWNKDSSLRKASYIKTYVNFLLLNHLNILVGMRDLTRYDFETKKVNKKPSVFIGAGLTFNDEDLKTILGAGALAF